MESNNGEEGNRTEKWSERFGRIIEQSTFRLDGKARSLEKIYQEEKKERWNLIRKSKDYYDEIEVIEGWQGAVDLLEEKGAFTNKEEENEPYECTVFRSMGGCDEEVYGGREKIGKVVLGTAIKHAMVRGSWNAAEDLERLIEDSDKEEIRGYEIQPINGIEVEELMIIEEGLLIAGSEWTKDQIDPLFIYRDDKWLNEWHKEWSEADSSIVREFTWGPALGDATREVKRKYKSEWNTDEAITRVAIGLNKRIERASGLYIRNDSLTDGITLAPDWPYAERGEGGIGTPYRIESEDIFKIWEMMNGRQEQSRQLKERCDRAMNRIESAINRRGKLEGADRILDIAIALETLYRTTGPEITEKLGTRAAHYLGRYELPEERLQIKRKVKRFYDLRSSVVHGRRQKESKEETEKRIEEMLGMARETLKERLRETEEEEDYWDKIVMDVRK